MHWTDLPLHIIDFEGNRECGIIEFGVVTLFHGEPVSTRTRLCRAQGRVPPEEVQLHGIRYLDTQNSPPFLEEWDYFISLRRSGPLGAHYARIENTLLKQVWPYPSHVPDFLTAGREIADWGLWIDTCALYQRLFPDLESHKLMDLIHRFHIQAELDAMAVRFCPETRSKYHCALYDALASALLLRSLSQLPGFKNITVEWLLAYSSPRGARAAQGKLFE